MRTQFAARAILIVMFNFDKTTREHIYACACVSVFKLIKFYRSNPWIFRAMQRKKYFILNEMYTSTTIYCNHYNL